MSWFVLTTGMPAAVEFDPAGGLTCIAMIATCVPAVLALRTALGRRMVIRSVATTTRRLAIVK